MRTILLNPGPVTLSRRVRQALQREDLCHREPEFAALQNRIREKLLKVYLLDQDKWAAALMTGSGTAAVESMITTLVPANGKLLVAQNGVYGERMTQIADRYAIANATITAPWGAPIDSEAVARALEADPAITHVAVVHHETTTGRLNELDPLGAVCREHGVAMLLDAVSSFGAEAIDFDRWPLAACAATANKCLHGVPGTCFVIARRSALEKAAPRSLYLDLAIYVSAQDQSGTPFTQSVQTFYALDEALDELAEAGGVDGRRARYQNCMRRIRSALRELGVKPLLDDDESSCVLRAYEIPEHADYDELHDRLKSAGFIIYAGQGAYAGDMFRISMMGDISDKDVERLVEALATALGR
ncbi:MAG TPA: 2-aminoethylphosphonate--pyruvate transaminase [Gammaproteobacteria bacterium]|jgi:2-aminoethylphosphonate-pyruvate transaminase|nr:2-aminoethylphosphonate--pyruvate transaminase [Gammaproteobacteria bacterium]